MTYSKSRVDRAGKQAVERLRAVIEGEPFRAEHRIEFVEAIDVIEWWRSEHARPLSQVAANLRHYVRKQANQLLPSGSRKRRRSPTSCSESRS